MAKPATPDTAAILTPPDAQGGLLRSFTAFAADIKLAHTMFALPFAASALLIARIPLPAPLVVLKLAVCMVAARSCAMGMNRWLDWRIDAVNPRTARRMIPAGRLSARAGLGWSVAWAAMFVATAASINLLTAMCSVPLLAILVGYSYTKRWTWLCHAYLGMCLGLAPIAVAIATTGAAPAAVLLLGLAVTAWTAGFDALYALQDIDFDRKTGLSSIPARFGPARALWISRGAFALMVALLLVVGQLAEFGAVYHMGVAVIAAVLAVEHWMVRDARVDGRSSRINAAFFNANASVSVIFFVAAAADRLLS